jgi:hypothetical protein
MMSKGKAAIVPDISYTGQYEKGGKVTNSPKGGASYNKKKHRGRITSVDASYGNIMQY